MELNTGIITDKKLNIGQLYDKNNIAGVQQLVDGRGLGNVTELAKIQASDAQEYDQFALSVACNNNRIVIGSPYEDTPTGGEGSVYIFDINGNEIKKIQSSDIEASDSFGWSVAVSDTIMVIGAKGEDTGGSGAGSAYIFDIHGNEITKIQASDAQETDAFASSVACSDTRIVVGAPSEDTGGLAAGAAYIFDLNGNELAKIIASDAEASDQFGYSVAVSDTRIVVGANFENTGGSAAGSAYIFDINGNELAKIQASDAEASDYFGWSVSCSNNRIVVSAYGEDTGGSGAGAVYIFDINGNELTKIQSSDIEASDLFGTSVSCSDNRIVVGAKGEDSTASGAGSVYIFDIHGNQISKIQASDAQGDDTFGLAVAYSNNRIVVGAPTEDTGGTSAGSAYIFEQKLLPSTTSDIAGTQPNSVTYANVIDEVYKIV